MNTTTPNDPSSSQPGAALSEPGADQWTAAKLESLEVLLALVERPGRGVIMMKGPAGFGKTTVAAALAVMLAKRGHVVHFCLTDDAANLAQNLDGKIEGLTVSRIDPVAETATYRSEILRVCGGTLSQAGRVMKEEDLRSPCTEEIAVFRAFAREIGERTDGFVVLDAAPSGHTLLLLDAGATSQRELERQAHSEQPAEVLRLLARVRDPAFARVLIITRPETAAVQTAAALQEDLRRAYVEPFGWIINQSRLGRGAGDPILRQREADEHLQVCGEITAHTPRPVWLPWTAEALDGADGLVRLGSARLQISGEQI